MVNVAIESRVRILFPNDVYKEAVVLRRWSNGAVDVRYDAGGTGANIDACRIELLSACELVRVLIGACAVLFLRYVVATFLSAFFPLRATELEISNLMNGFIFAAYPMGIAMASIFAPRLLRLVGCVPGIVFGLVATGVLTIAFGLVPDAMGGAPIDGVPLTTLQRQQQWAFFALYFLNGLLGSLAENGALALATEKTRVVRPSVVGRVMAAIGMITGLGCMAGPPLGGVLNKFPGLSDAWQFRLPFVVFGFLPVLIGLIIPFLIPRPPRMPIPRGGPGRVGTVVATTHYPLGEGLGAPQPEGRIDESICRVISASSVTTLVALALNGTFVATLDPTLARRLGDAHPFAAPSRRHTEGFEWSESTIGLFFMLSSILYTLVSIPVGYVIDVFAGNSMVLKLIQALGFLVLAVCFFLLGPGIVPGLPAAEDDAVFDTFNLCIPAIVSAMVAKGIGSAGNNAAYNDLIVGVPSEDAFLSASISSLWNGAYAVGWAVGPLLGGALYEFGPRVYATVIYTASLVCCALLILAALFRCSAPIAHIEAIATDGETPLLALGIGGVESASLNSRLLPKGDQSRSLVSSLSTSSGIVEGRQLSSCEVFAASAAAQSEGGDVAHLSAGGGRALTWAHHIVPSLAETAHRLSMGPTSSTARVQLQGGVETFHSRWATNSLTRYSPPTSLSAPSQPGSLAPKEARSLGP